jgi:hypothetical protein
MMATREVFGNIHGTARSEGAVMSMRRLCPIAWSASPQGSAQIVGRRRCAAARKHFFRQRSLEYGIVLPADDDMPLFE